MYTQVNLCAPHWLPIQLKYSLKMGFEIDERRVFLWSIRNNISTFIFVILKYKESWTNYITICLSQKNIITDHRKTKHNQCTDHFRVKHIISYALFSCYIFPLRLNGIYNPQQTAGTIFFSSYTEGPIIYHDVHKWDWFLRAEYVAFCLII